MRETDSAVASIVREGGCAIGSGAGAVTMSRRVTVG
jgi:cyanophycinase-like exopeptidase